MNGSPVKIIIMVLIAFAVVISVTGILGNIFGKEAELISLGVIALILIVLLINEKRK